MRRRILVLIAAVLGLLAVAHVFYWYAPRERPGSPTAGDPTAAVYASETLPLRLWIPYPHQNLAALRREAPQGLASILRLLGVRLPTLRRFGPFEIPPSRAVAIASDTRGDRFVAVAAVYPTVRWISRAAGRLARNPWLTGGTVESGGRPLRVGWSGGFWWVTSDPEIEIEPLLATSEPFESLPASLAWLRTSRDLGPLPAGTYRLSGPASAPALRFRDEAGNETTVLDLGGDGSRLEIRLPAR